jgi:glyoxylase-like metal-dependent hydrolase (beta-lactamase superfamily II)
VLWGAGLGADVPRYATPAATRTAARWREELCESVARESPGHELPLFARLTAATGDVIPWDGPTARVIAHDAHAPGHGAVYLPEAGVLVAGDMVSDVEVPLPDMESADPFGAYRAGLGLLASLPGVRTVVPGHGHTGDGAAFRARVAADLAYLDAVQAGAPVTDPRLAAGEEWLRQEHARHVSLARNRR